MNTVTFKLKASSKFVNQVVIDVLSRQFSRSGTLCLYNSALHIDRTASEPIHFTRTKTLATRYMSYNILNSETDIMWNNRVHSESGLSKRHASKASGDVEVDKTQTADSLPDKEEIKIEEKVTLTKAQMLKKAVAEYGSTVIIFHVTISLVSLGICYSLVSSGMDAGQIFETLGLGENKIASNTGTFVAAYAIHKVMAPLRISITLGATPLIVRYLRNRGILKK